MGSWSLRGYLYLSFGSQVYDEIQRETRRESMNDNKESKRTIYSFSTDCDVVLVGVGGTCGQLAFLSVYAVQPGLCCKEDYLQLLK
jgi:hypothetical protein